MTTGIHIDFDHAWDPSLLPMRTIDARSFGPPLRYISSQQQITRTFDALSEIKSQNFFLYGSGDFHYLAAWFLKTVLHNNPIDNITLLSFDNHPDWDIRPPKWACGGWINRALEIENIASASVWGCGNFELTFPSRLFRNRRALKTGKLEIHAWVERQKPAVAKMFHCMTRDNWRNRFQKFASSLAGKKLYITIDMDCLAPEHALTNWENGLFTPDDLAWAIRTLRENATVIGGDLCGAWSPEQYARPLQRFAAKFDHPTISPRTLDQARSINHASLDILWPALTGT